MRLYYDSEPVADRFFSVTATDFIRPASLTFYIGDLQVAEKECLDPPCHEVIYIPKETAGNVLRIVAVDASGETKTLRLMIGGGREYRYEQPSAR